MLPVVALVGRPNVGKSTLFNALTGTRDALVADIPGLTRDRKYGYGESTPHRFIVIDTGGLIETPSGISELMARQTDRAIEEADRVVFLVDGRHGIDPADRFVADVLRRSGKPVTVAVNKSEDRDSAVITAEFHAFGFGEPLAISAEHRQGIDLLQQDANGLFELEYVRRHGQGGSHASSQAHRTGSADFFDFRHQPL